MTALSKSAWRALYPDNQTGAITARTLRDGVDSALGCYGQLRGAGVAQEVNTEATFRGFDETTIADHTTLDASAGTIEVAVSGVYDVRAVVMSTAHPASFDLAINDVGVGYPATGEHVVLSQLLELSEGDRVSMLVGSIGDTNYTWDSAVLYVRRVG